MSKEKKKSVRSSKANSARAEEKLLVQEKYAELQAKLYHLQSWFIRISWRKKANFITKAIRSINDIAILRNIVEALSAVTKDVSYARGQTSKFSYDVTPIDDNRCLSEISVNENAEINWNWFKTLDNDRDKLKVILYLINVAGGTGMVNLAIQEAQTLIKIWDCILELHPRFVKKSKFKLKHTAKLAKLTTNEMIKNPNVLPIVDEYKTFLTLAKPKVVIKDQVKSFAYKRSAVASMAKTYLSPFDRALRTVRNKQNLWERELKKLIRMARTGGLSERASKTIFAYESHVDSLQTLPVWINRQIVNLLDNDSKENLKKVNIYWKYTIEEVQRENWVRSNLNEIIRKMETQLMNMKLPGKRFAAQIRKRIKRAKSAESLKKPKKPIRRSYSTDLAKLLRNKDDFKESIYKFVHKIPNTDIPFNGLYRDMIIPTIYMYDRAIDCNRKWIAATDNTFIVFYNIITGAKSPFLLSGHSLVVTCLSFFPKSLRVASGSLDTTVRTWDLWNGSVIEIFTGHTDVIISVSVNEDYLVSCARDSEIRVFKQLSGGVCTKLINDILWTPTMVVLSEDNVVYWATREGAIKVFSITDQNFNKSIDFAHRSDITHIAKFGPLIVTAGNDYYVRIWNRHFVYQKCITQIHHESSVNSVACAYLTLITACADGALRFWHIGTGILLRTIQVNFPEFPMISLKCQEHCNHIKIVCNNEHNIYVLEFRKKYQKRIKKGNLYQCIRLHPIDSRTKVTSKNKRLFKVNISKCTLPEFRNRTNYKNYIPSHSAKKKK
ncbi:F-box/WD repeat-containing protein 10-like [Rhodnius prolixus]|uniref:WD_REPEATS_REGION domain-containing protein n=1 Tax=Rhodnius prolixus TaxID=13249 RepID=T1IC62_RHOPR